MFYKLILRELRSMKNCIPLNLNTQSHSSGPFNNIEPSIRSVIEFICYYEEFTPPNLYLHQYMSSDSTRVSTYSS
jgi:hypothetical protein